MGRGGGYVVRVRVGRGTIADYDALSGFHYRGGRPATFPCVLVARRGEEAVGVLVASMPTLRGWWRGVAWPEIGSSSRSEREIRRLNAEVRSISRVVVDPRWRSLGVATRLVRAYLRRWSPARVEAPAAMGEVSPFFVRAGMREVRGVESTHDARLRRRLSGVGIGVGGRRRVEDLIDARVASAELSRRRGLEEVLRRWARGSVRTRRGSSGVGGVGLAAMAAARLSATPIAYVWSRRGV